MQRIAHILANKAQYTDVNRKLGVAEKVIEALRDKAMPIFMLSNQLPMLQLGRELPEVSGQRVNYCQPQGAQYAKRIFKETPIIAFSDPNDLLSYGIPAGFNDKYLDSRLCTKITNVNINIANVIDAFGISDLANPLEAHLGYDQDDRVIALIAHGIGHEQSADLIKNRCEFTKTVE